MKFAVCIANYKFNTWEKFLAMSISDRRITIKDSGLYFNNFLKGHRVATCNLSGCPGCGAKHNTRLDLNEQQPKLSNTASWIV